MSGGGRGGEEEEEGMMWSNVVFGIEYVTYLLMFSTYKSMDNISENNGEEDKRLPKEMASCTFKLKTPALLVSMTHSTDDI
jgi:hypothetical protein